MTVRKRVKLILLFRRFRRASGRRLLVVARGAGLLVDLMRGTEVLLPFSLLLSVLQETDLSPRLADSPSARLDSVNETLGVSPGHLRRSCQMVLPSSLCVPDSQAI